MPRNFIANDPSNIESSQRWLHIRGVVRPNDTERTMWWNWILILPIKSYRNYPKLLFMRRRRTSGVRTAQRRRKTTTQRREEGQMKSCVSNNVLPIPREIYFSGFAVSTPNFSRFYFTQSPTEKKPQRCVSRNDQKAFHIPENHGSQISLCLLRFVFSWIQRRETAKKPILSHLGVVIELKLASAASLVWATELNFRLPFRSAFPPLGTYRCGGCNWFHSISPIQPTSRVDTSMWSDIPIGIGFRGQESSNLFTIFQLVKCFRYETPWNIEAQSEAFERNPGRWINWQRRECTPACSIVDKFIEWQACSLLIKDEIIWWINKIGFRWITVSTLKNSASQHFLIDGPLKTLDKFCCT